MIKMDEAKSIMGELSGLQKYIILLLNANNNEMIKGNTWFQKELFLIVKNVEELSEEASFESDFYGPFSENAVEQLEELEMDDVVIRSGNKMFLSKLGLKISEDISKKTPKERLLLIAEFKSLINDLNDDEVLTFIYFSFPEFTSESLVLEKIKKNRRTVAIKLYQKGKISLQRASEIADIPLEKFIQELKL